MENLLCGLFFYTQNPFSNHYFIKLNELATVQNNYDVILALVVECGND